jgi:hypothetical protein
MEGKISASVKVARKYLRCLLSSDPGMFLGNTEMMQQLLHKCWCKEDIYIYIYIYTLYRQECHCDCKTNVITTPMEFPALPTAMRST